ncbi:18908_t:CDS:2 [Gigaspora rosea]|nr:18908_t:CDS:2 [Gigaspora rosea]
MTTRIWSQNLLKMELYVITLKKKSMSISQKQKWLLISRMISDFGLSTTKKALSLGEQGGAPERFAYNSKPYEKYKDDPKFSKLFDEKMAKHYKDQPHLSDVYSYGLVVWEIATNDMVLYPEVKNVVSLLEIKIRDDIKDLVKALDRKNVPTIFRYVIKECCVFDPLKRIDLIEIILDLKNMYKNIVWNDHGRSHFLKGEFQEAINNYTEYKN